MELQRTRFSKTPRRPWIVPLWIGVFGLSTAIAFAPAAGEGLLQKSPFPQLPPELNPTPDANAQARMQEERSQKQNFEAANATRKKQIGNDSTKILKLATDLNTEVDKTAKDTLSLKVIREADEIEKLAHDVQEKMKLTVGST